MLRSLVIVLCTAPLLLGGCASLRDAVIRGRLMDHRYYRDIGPKLMDSFRMKMENGIRSLGPATPAPDWLDRG